MSVLFYFMHSACDFAFKSTSVFPYLNFWVNELLWNLLSLEVCVAWSGCCYKNGRQQPCNGHGSKLLALHIGRSAGFVQQRSQRSRLHASADTPSRHQWCRWHCVMLHWWNNLERSGQHIEQCTFCIGAILLVQLLDLSVVNFLIRWIDFNVSSRIWYLIYSCSCYIIITM